MTSADTHVDFRKKKKMNKNTFFGIVAIAATIFASTGCSTVKASDGLSSKQLKISVLGDSYSTFEGEIPEGNDIWYYKPPKTKGGIDSPDKTWWKQVVDRLGAKLLINESWSGATISSTGYGKADFSNRSFVTRAVNLGADSDLILVCGGLNDSWAGSPLGEMKWSDWTDEDLKCTRPSVCKMFSILKDKYPKAKILFIIPQDVHGEIQQAIREAAGKYGAETVGLSGIELSAGHPTVKGMKAFADQVMDALVGMGYKPEFPKDVKFTDDGKPKQVVVENFMLPFYQTVLTGTDISKVKLVAADLGGGWVPGGPYASKICFEKRDEQERSYTCQVQSCSPEDGHMRVVCLKFKQELNGDVVCRALWNRYKFNSSEYGVDFSKDENCSGGCATAGNYSIPGYVVGKMTLGVNQ